VDLFGLDEELGLFLFILSLRDDFPAFEGLFLTSGDSLLVSDLLEIERRESVDLLLRLFTVSSSLLSLVFLTLELREFESSPLAAVLSVLSIRLPRLPSLLES